MWRSGINGVDDRWAATVLDRCTAVAAGGSDALQLRKPAVYLVPALGRIPLATLTAADVRAFFTRVIADN